MIRKVRFLPEAVDDLLKLARRDSSVAKKVRRRLIYVASDSNVGLPLTGEFAGYWKLKVSQPELRIVWRIIHDADGSEIVEIAEIIVIGGRANNEVYKELRRRIVRLEGDAELLELAEVLKMIASGKKGKMPKSVAKEPVPSFLEEVLIAKIGLSKEQVLGLSGPEALELWTLFVRKQK